MTDAHLDQYFELAMDLPEKKREELIRQLEKEDPASGAQLRGLLDKSVTNPDFLCQSGVSGEQPRAMAPGRLDTVHHVAVQVADIGAAVAWYRARFGCLVDYEDATWALLRFDNFRLALVLPGKHPPHFAVTRSDAEEFGELTTHRDGTRSVYIKDPWGNAVEILDRDSLGALEDGSGEGS